MPQTQTVLYEQIGSNGNNQQINKNIEETNIKESLSDIIPLNPKIASSPITEQKAENANDENNAILTESSNPINKQSTNQTEELIKKVANAIKQTNSVDPRLK